VCCNRGIHCEATWHSEGERRLSVSLSLICLLAHVENVYSTSVELVSAVFCSMTAHTRVAYFSSRFTFRQIILSNRQRYLCRITRMSSLDVEFNNYCSILPTALTSKIFLSKELGPFMAFLQQRHLLYCVLLVCCLAAAICLLLLLFCLYTDALNTSYLNM